MAEIKISSELLSKIREKFKANFEVAFNNAKNCFFAYVVLCDALLSDDFSELLKTMKEIGFHFECVHADSYQLVLTFVKPL